MQQQQDEEERDQDCDAVQSSAEPFHESRSPTVIQSFELEQSTNDLPTETIQERGSWLGRISRLGPSEQLQHQTYSNDDDDVNVYYGGPMEQQTNCKPSGNLSLEQQRQCITRTSSSTSEFNDWTPPDSSYGAAIPIGGWIPKQIRRFMEWTLLASVVCASAFFLISTSIRISNKQNSGLLLDDDRYIEYDHYITNATMAPTSNSSGYYNDTNYTSYSTNASYL
jgi:hypothetical protein